MVSNEEYNKQMDKRFQFHYYNLVLMASGVDTPL